METITLTKNAVGIAVGGKTFDVKDVLRAAGARWDAATSTWIFRGAEDVQHVANTIRDAVEDVRQRIAEARVAEKARAAWLKTDEGKAATLAAEQKRVAAAFHAGTFWLCCASCTVVDWKRQHVSCKEHGFQVRGGLYTGD
jgi:hypothetical protein